MGISLRSCASVVLDLGRPPRKDVGAAFTAIWLGGRLALSGGRSRRRGRVDRSRGALAYGYRRLRSRAGEDGREREDHASGAERHLNCGGDRAGADVLSLQCLDRFAAVPCPSQ